PLFVLMDMPTCRPQLAFRGVIVSLRLSRKIFKPNEDRGRFASTSLTHPTLRAGWGTRQQLAGRSAAIRLLEIRLPERQWGRPEDDLTGICLHGSAVAFVVRDEASVNGLLDWNRDRRAAATEEGEAVGIAVVLCAGLHGEV